MATALQPLLERGEVMIFGEATPELFRSNIETDSVWARQFEVIRIEPQGPESITKIVKQVADELAEDLANRCDWYVRWTPEAIARAETLGNDFFPSVAPPAGTIRLLKEVLNDRRMSRQHRLPENVHIIEEGGFLSITPNVVVESLCDITGAPRVMLDDSMALSLDETRNFFTERLVGQRHAIDTVVDLLAKIKAGMNQSRGPQGVMLFVGPTGVGKTEMARTLAHFLFGSPEKMIRMDMSEYSEVWSVQKIIGSHNSDAAAGGLLARVKQDPFSLVLLDEIEKAHSSVFDLLLQMFDAGQISKANGESIDFSQTVVILTSNLGSSNIEERSMGFNDDSRLTLEESVMDAIHTFFRPELINRLEQIVVFEPLGRDDVRLLAQRELYGVLQRSGITRRGLKVDFDRGLIDIVARAGYDRKFGARPLKRAVDRLVVTPLARMIAQMDPANAPALIQLVPSGDRIHLKTIKSHKRKMTEPVSPHHSAGKKPKSIDLKSIRANLTTLTEATALLPAISDSSDLRQKRTTLIAESNRANFWDDPLTARKSLNEIQRIDTLIHHIQNLIGTKENLEQTLQQLGDNIPQDMLESIGEKMQEALRSSTLLRFASLCSSEIEECDAILVLDAVNEDASEHINTLIDCYSKWASNLGFTAESIHEEYFEKGELKQALLRIQGVTVYGMLAGEHGLHEFAKEDGKEGSLVKLSVMPISDTPFDQDEIEMKTGSVKRAGKIIRQIRFEVSSIHKPTGVQVSICSGLGKDETIEASQELLKCEVERIERMKNNIGESGHEMVRRWWMGTGPQVRDPRTNVTIKKLKPVLSGNINPFLIGWLEWKNQ
jgi:protein subunit release factor A